MQRVPQRSSTAALFAILVLGFEAPALGQTWTTGFFNTNQGWVVGTVVTGQNTNDSAGARWQGNDPETEVSPGVYVGGTLLIGT